MDDIYAEATTVMRELTDSGMSFVSTVHYPESTWTIQVHEPKVFELRSGPFRGMCQEWVGGTVRWEGTIPQWLSGDSRWRRISGTDDEVLAMFEAADLPRSQEIGGCARP